MWLPYIAWVLITRRTRKLAVERVDRLDLTIIGELSKEVRGSRVLIALPIGSKDEDLFRFEEAFMRWREQLDFDIAFFHFDGNSQRWKEESWYNDLNVILSVDKPGFLYGFFRDYLDKEISSRYDWMILVNSDVDARSFDLRRFLDTIDELDPLVAQPATDGKFAEDRSWYPICNPRDDIRARATDFVEIGPFVAMRPEAWDIIRRMIPPKETGAFVNGYGLDMVWCQALQPLRGWRGTLPCSSEHYSPVCVIVDETAIRHINLQEGRDNPMSGYDEITALQDKEWILKNYRQFVTSLENRCEMRLGEKLWSDATDSEEDR